MSVNKKISELDTAGTIDGTELLLLVQDSLSVKATISALNAYLSSVLVGGSNIIETGTVTSGTWNSRIQKRVVDVPSSANIAVDSDVSDMITVVNLATNTNINNPTGTPYDGQELEYWIKDDSTPRNLTFDTDFKFSSSLAAPSSTSLSRRLYLKFIWVELELKWLCTNKLDNF